jgi:hypothetical protein
MKIVRAIRNGWIKPKKSETDKPRYYMIWDQDDTQVRMTSWLGMTSRLVVVIGCYDVMLWHHMLV